MSSMESQLWHTLTDIDAVPHHKPVFGRRYNWGKLAKDASNLSDEELLDAINSTPWNVRGVALVCKREMRLRPKIYEELMRILMREAVRS